MTTKDLLEGIGDISDSEAFSDPNIPAYEKRVYDLQQILEITRSLCSTLEFSNLIQSILDNCMAQFLVQNAGIFLLESFDSKVFTLSSNYTGFDLDPGIVYEISVTSPLARIFEKENTVYSVERLRQLLDECDESRREEDTQKLSKEMDVLESLNPTLIVPLLQKGHLEGILVFGERIIIGDDSGYLGEYYSDYEKEQILTIASLAAIAINNATLVERSSTDMMTKLKLNYFFNVLSEKLDYAKKNARKLAVLMFDVDFFKKCNDTYGHACGDYILVTVASIIRESIRAEDLAARYGGEEFTVMLSDACQDSAVLVGERIRKKVEAFDFSYEDKHIKVTISVGVALLPQERNQDITPNMLVDFADKALYVSKRSGRNRVTLATEEIIADTVLPE